MNNKLVGGMVKSLKPLLVNNFTREFVRGLMDRDKYLELKLDEICRKCTGKESSSGNNGLNLDIRAIEECRREYFGQLLQSFVGRPGDDETKKLFSYLKKCEECLSSKINNTIELQKSGQTIRK